jgi:DNA-binding GntR family transcriptional regulator
MSPQPVVKIATSLSKSTQVYEQLKRALLYGRFPAGEVLSIRALGELFGTSTMPVRGAISRLIAEGALKTLPNRGVRVPVLSHDQMEDLYRARVALEGMAVELASQNVSARELRELEAHEEHMERALERNRLSDAVRANLEFHFLLYRISHSEILVTLIEALYLRYAPSLYNVIETLPGGGSDRSMLAHAQHTAILEALRRRDPAAARLALESDLSIARSVRVDAATRVKPVHARRTLRGRKLGTSGHGQT